MSLPVFSLFLFLLSFTTTCLSVSPSVVFLHGRFKDGFLGKPPAPASSAPLPPEKWFTQRLNHFNSADTRLWKQRYFVNDSFYQKGGPVFVMIGGEGPANPIWMGVGQWIELAKFYKAMCFQVEHRFYGKSHPTSDMSTPNLQYLSSEQALADLANFRTVIGESMNLKLNKWVSFGGSYSGALSAWLRTKYPHLFDAAVATSAPILAKLNFLNYFNVVKNALDTTGPTCSQSVAAATASIKTLLKSKSGLNTLKDKFSLCVPLDPKNTKNIANFWTSLAGNFAGVVQYNKDNRAFEGAVGTNITVDTLCKIMNDKTIGDSLSRYSAVNSLLLKTHGQGCLDYDYKTMVTGLQKTSWTSAAGVGGRQWTYQTCTEFGFYQTSDFKNQPFGDGFPLQFSIDQCTDIFGKTFTQPLNQGGINTTNINYGALGLKSSKIVFPNGSIDPWHALGVTKSLSNELIAVFINGTAHCANMYPSSSQDLPQLKAARLQIKSIIGKWIK